MTPDVTYTRRISLKNDVNAPKYFKTHYYEDEKGRLYKTAYYAEEPMPEDNTHNSYMVWYSLVELSNL